jgi:hypothetical protein
MMSNAHPDCQGIPRGSCSGQFAGLHARSLAKLGMTPAWMKESHYQIR